MQDCFDDRLGQPSLDREPAVGPPLVLRLPVPSIDEDRELVEPLRQRGVKATVLAKMLDTIGELGAPQECAEWSADSTARAEAITSYMRCCASLIWSGSRCGSHPFAFILTPPRPANRD